MTKPVPSAAAGGVVYAPGHATDRNRSVHDWRHWSNDPSQMPSAEHPQWLLLEWAADWLVEEVRLYTMEGYAVQDYAIETSRGTRGSRPGLPRVPGGTCAQRCRCCSRMALAGGVRNARIGVLYPIAAARANLERFWDEGGVISAAGTLPRNSERELPSPAAGRCGQRLFGLGPGDAGKAPSSATSRKGGIGIYLPPDRVAELPAILDQVIEPDVELLDPKAPLRIARRAVDGRDVFLLISDSGDPWQGSVSFGQPHPAGERLDPATGEIRPLTDARDVALDLGAWGAAIVRLEGVQHLPRLRPARIGFATAGQ